jgi:hypothetical protein
MSLPKLIKNDWHREPGEPFAIANILFHQVHPEGLDVDRIKFHATGTLPINSNAGHIISILHGNARLNLSDEPNQTLYLGAGVHLFLPPGLDSFFSAEPGTEFLRVSSPSAGQVRGKRLLLRDEQFLSACASDSQSLRWILTPQYLSRRIFLNNDLILTSKSGNPVSWFRTTMFDVIGLPKNQNGDPVFKMSYNSRTEFNVCYEVKGTARVRMAQHPYSGEKQPWDPWLTLDGDSTYHLNEAAGSPEEEYYLDEVTKTPQFFRNKHEVFIVNGYVSLFCLFDPSPTGVERHHPGEYSDYEPLQQVMNTNAYEIFQREITRYDQMIDTLSLAKARGELKALQGSAMWKLYEIGREAQITLETELVNKLRAEGDGREQIIAQWMQSV